MHRLDSARQHGWLVRSIASRARAPAPPTLRCACPAGAAPRLPCQRCIAPALLAPLRACREPAGGACTPRAMGGPKAGLFEYSFGTRYPDCTQRVKLEVFRGPSAPSRLYGHLSHQLEYLKRRDPKTQTVLKGKSCEYTSASATRFVHTKIIV